jgi:glycosyltransferase involved in cell wall biosynthesis
VAECLSIAHVSPYAWEAPGEVGNYVQRVSAELSRRGHRVLVIAPSESATLVRESREALRRDPAELLERASERPLVLGVGEVLAFAPSRRRAASLPIDVARTIEEALQALPLDIVHVHEPFAPSASSVALRHSRALNVGSFHAPTERILSTQLTRPLSRLLFARLDARIASYRATRELMSRFFPGDYEVILPGADAPARPALERSGGPPEIAFVAAEERAALRSFLRALRALPPDLEWRARIFSGRPLVAPASLPRMLHERVRLCEASDSSAARGVAECEIVALASEGGTPAPWVLLQALAAGTVPVCPRIDAYEELLAGGEHGLMFEPGDVQTLCEQLSRALSDPALRAQLRERAAQLRPRLAWARAAAEVERVYARLVARRHDRRARPAVRARLASRPLIDVDLHMHTDHSPDCATPVEVLLAQARARGLEAIAITDHNEISGALDAVAKADGIKVIVGEEIKTGEQGEVIGLFLSERIPRGLTLERTIAEIKAQGGIVYVPHPFDRLHSVPDYQHLLAVLDQIDAIEVFNPRVAISEFNEEAARFAAKYRIPAGAGSDAHVPQGLGSVRIRMRDFASPEEFLESLRDADIARKPGSLLYVQALKFLQTRALPGPARRAARERRVRRARRATRNS